MTTAPSSPHGRRATRDRVRRAADHRRPASSTPCRPRTRRHRAVPAPVPAPARHLRRAGGLLARRARPRLQRRRPVTTVADGRARTFIPLVPEDPEDRRHRPRGARPARVRHTPTAARRPPGLAAGPLARAGCTRWSVRRWPPASRPITWLVDPAVPDAARASRGNPPSWPARRRTATRTATTDGDDGTARATTPRVRGPGPRRPTPVTDAGPGRPTTRPRRGSGGVAWLDRLHSGRGQPDAEPALRRPRRRRRGRPRARRSTPPDASGPATDRAVVSTSPVVAPPAASSRWPACDLTDAAATVLVDRPDAGDAAPTVGDADGHTAGGRLDGVRRAAAPAPRPARRARGPAAAPREAALHALSPRPPSPWSSCSPPTGTRAPTGRTPTSSRPSTSPGSHLPSSARSRPPVAADAPVDRPAYPELPQRPSSHRRFVSAARTLAGTGDTIESLLTRTTRSAATAPRRGAARTSSCGAGASRASPRPADRSRDSIAPRLGAVHDPQPVLRDDVERDRPVLGTLVNGLDQPVTVGLRRRDRRPAESDPPGPGRARPGGRRRCSSTRPRPTSASTRSPAATDDRAASPSGSPTTCRSGAARSAS